MNTYLIRYKDRDPACPEFQSRVRGYDREHAIERFWELSPDDDDWEILSVERWS